MLLPIVVFIAVTCACIGLIYMAIPEATDKRLHALTAKDGGQSQSWQARMADVVTPFAKLSTPTGDWVNSPLRVKFMNAGIRYTKAPHIFFGLKTLLPVGFALPTFFYLGAAQDMTGMKLLFLVLCAAVIGCYLPNVILHLAARSRTHEIFVNFPDAADLMLVCVEAGLGLDSALTRVAEELITKSPELAEELHMCNLEMRAGGSREKSLHNLALRTGVDELHSFATMLTQAGKFGTSIGESLRVFSDDLRYKRQVRAEEHAAKVPTKMLFPLVLFIFPSIIMVVLGPAIIQIIRTLGPALSHNG